MTSRERVSSPKSLLTAWHQHQQYDRPESGFNPSAKKNPPKTFHPVESGSPATGKVGGALILRPGVPDARMESGGGSGSGGWQALRLCDLMHVPNQNARTVGSESDSVEKNRPVAEWHFLRHSTTVVQRHCQTQACIVMQNCATDATIWGREAGHIVFIV
jgi:hypothetical protein